MTSSCIRLEFLDRKRDGIAYRTFYGHGAPHASLGEPGALFVDESKHVLYGRTDAGWTKFPGTAADKTKSVKHPVLADTILWCTPNQYGWTKASDCTNRGSYQGWLTAMISFEHRKIRLKDPAFIRQTFSFTPVVEAPSMTTSPSKPALSSLPPPPPPPSSPLPSMPKLDLQSISVRKSAKSSPSNLLRKIPPVRPKVRPSVSIDAQQSQNQRKTSVRYSPYLAPSSPKRKERESLTGGQSLVESFASTSKGKGKEVDNSIGTQQELSPLFTPIQTSPIFKSPTLSSKGKGKEKEIVEDSMPSEQSLPLGEDKSIGASKGKEKEGLVDSPEASPLFTPLTIDNPIVPLQAKGKEKEVLSDSISIKRKGKAREAAVRSLSPATDTSPVRHKDKGRESVRYSPYGERSPGPSSPRSRMGRRVSARQPSVPLISHSDTPEPDIQANEVTPTKITTPEAQESPTLAQPNSITHDTIDLTLSDDEDVRDDCSDLAYPTTPEDFDMSEPEFERLPTPPPLPAPIPPVVTEPEPEPAPEPEPEPLTLQLGESLSGDQQDVFCRIYRELDTNIYAVLFSEVGSNHYCNACLLNSADDADDYVLETFCIAGEGHTMLWHFLMVHCAFKKHYHSIETQTVLHWADLLRLQPEH